MKQDRVTYKPTRSGEYSHVMFVNGENFSLGTIGLSAMASERTEAAFRSAIGPLMKVLNAPGGVVDTPEGKLLTFQQPADWARTTHAKWLTGEGCVIKPIKGRGGATVSVRGVASAPARGTSAVRGLVESLRAAGLFQGQNPYAINGLHLLSDAERVVAFGRAPKVAKDAEGQRHDNGAFYRFGAGAHRLQTDAIFCGAAMRQALEGAPRVIVECFENIRAHALRANIGGCGYTMYCIHKADGFNRPRSYFFNKGDRVEPTLLVAQTDVRWEGLKEYVDGDRRGYDALSRGWDDFRELSRLARLGDSAADEILRAERVWLVRSGTPLTYPNLTQTYTRPRFLAANIEQTLHKLRHEFVYYRLREIEAMDVPEHERQQMRGRLAKQMGWTSQAMFKVYDAYEQECRRLAELLEYQDRLDRGVAAALHRGLAPEDRPQALPLSQRASSCGAFFFSFDAVA